jgi:hypothetical protein
MIRRVIKIGSALLVVASWLALCCIGLSVPTLVRRPLALAIENLKVTELEIDAIETWQAVHPVSQFTKRLGERTVLLSTLMLVGFIGVQIGSKER